MPLTRGTVTAASRIMLPTYVVFFAVTGFNYLLTPHDRIAASPALAYADSVIDIRGWGSLFLAAAVLMATALCTRRRVLYRYALLLCSLALAIWTSVAILAAFRSQATPAGWVYPGFVLAACCASYRSLTTGEVD